MNSDIYSLEYWNYLSDKYYNKTIDVSKFNAHCQSIYYRVRDNLPTGWSLKQIYSNSVPNFILRHYPQLIFHYHVENNLPTGWSFKLFIKALPLEKAKRLFITHPEAYTIFNSKIEDSYSGYSYRNRYLYRFVKKNGDLKNWSLLRTCVGKDLRKRTQKDINFTSPIIPNFGGIDG